MKQGNLKYGVIFDFLKTEYSIDRIEYLPNVLNKLFIK